jgi:hypothetical protein
MNEKGPNDINLGPSDKNIMLHALMLWSACSYFAFSIV